MSPPPATVVRHRLRLRFRKEGELRMISHRDLARTLERLFRRAGLALSMSEGFHPKPRMSFPVALAVGIAGWDEVMELELAEVRSPSELLAALAPHAPPGLTFAAAEVVPAGAPVAQPRRLVYELPVPADRRAAADAGIEAFVARASCVVRREPRGGTIDLRGGVDELMLRGDRLRIGVRFARDGTPRPREVLQALGLADLESQGLWLVRAAVELA